LDPSGPPKEDKIGELGKVRTLTLVDLSLSTHLPTLEILPLILPFVVGPANN
jgi:hypothetical protein